jgi:hypothetical protein
MDQIAVRSSRNGLDRPGMLQSITLWMSCAMAVKWRG